VDNVTMVAGKPSPVNQLSTLHSVVSSELINLCQAQSKISLYKSCQNS